jgi:hypothetical protein
MQGPEEMEEMETGGRVQLTYSVRRPSSFASGMPALSRSALFVSFSGRWALPEGGSSAWSEFTWRGRVLQAFPLFG